MYRAENFTTNSTHQSPHTFQISAHLNISGLRSIFEEGRLTLKNLNPWNFRAVLRENRFLRIKIIITLYFKNGFSNSSDVYSRYICNLVLLSKFLSKDVPSFGSYKLLRNPVFWEFWSFVDCDRNQTRALRSFVELKHSEIYLIQRI